LSQGVKKKSTKAAAYLQMIIIYAAIGGNGIAPGTFSLTGVGLAG
jgi:hypothetical protein